MQSDGHSEQAAPVSAVSGCPPSTGELETWVLFVVDEQTYALQIQEVERIVRAVEVKPLPQSPPHVLGVVNMQGQIVPVINLRLVLGRPVRDIHPDDHFVVARMPALTAILPVDAALGSLEVVDTTMLPDEKARDRCLRKIVPLRESVVYVLDLERVVFGDESPATSTLASALADVQTT
jgi:purine-binding chemotaxis protein CheW